MLKKILGGLFKPEERPERSEGLVQLTVWEKKHIEKTDGKCPDCGTGALLEGPQGGCSMNVLCDSCGAKFNLVLAFGGVPIGERIGTPTQTKSVAMVH